MVERDKAEAAAATVVAQNEKTQAELNFYQTTDPEERLAELHKLFSRPDPDSQARARQLFFALPELDQLSLLRVESQPMALAEVGRGLLPNLADVNRTGHTDRHLQALRESLPDGDEAAELKTELAQWLACREAARQGEAEAALVQYNGLIERDGDNPALWYERAGVQADLENYSQSLADLSRVMALANRPEYASNGVLPTGPEFATTDRMTRAVRRLMMIHPDLAAELAEAGADHPALAEIELPEVKTDGEGAPLVRVPAGRFKMGSDDSFNEQPVHEVYLDEYYIDRFEVTNARYATFLNARGNQEEGGVTWLAAEYSRISQEGEEWLVETGYADHPVTGVSWYGAKAYCEWRGGRLPTEAEWEKAARGADGRTYPWGEEIECHLANYIECDTNNTTPVGSYPAGISPYGAYDMAGNVWEWVQSEYRDYPYRADDGRESLDSTNVRVLRGGSWYNGDGYARATYRDDDNPAGQGGYVGFRCVVEAP